MPILLTLSIIGLAMMKKWGAALTAFTLSYAFAFNTFNIIYFGLSELNLINAVMNAIALILVFKNLSKNKFHQPHWQKRDKQTTLIPRPMLSSTFLPASDTEGNEDGYRIYVSEISSPCLVSRFSVNPILRVPILHYRTLLP